MEPFILDDHIEVPPEEVIEVMGDELMGLDNVRIISLCRGEKIAREPFENPTTSTSSSEAGSSAAVVLFLLFFFLLKSSVAAVELLEEVEEGNDIQ